MGSRLLFYLCSFVRSLYSSKTLLLLIINISFPVVSFFPCLGLGFSSIKRNYKFRSECLRISDLILSYIDANDVLDLNDF